MYIKNIKLLNFRNYKKLLVSFNKGINIICGSNAQGKTNLLESIYVLGLTKSHKNINEKNLIRNGNSNFYMRGSIKKNKIATTLEIFYDETKKNLKIDNENIKKVNDYISNMNIIIFTPDDLEIIKSSPQVRRKYIDTELSQLYSDYYVILNDYKKLLKMRNDYLKKIVKTSRKDEAYLDTLTSLLIDKSIIIYKMRDNFINKVNLYCSKIYKDIMNLDNFKILYKSDIDINQDKEIIKRQLEKIYKKRYEIDLKQLSTSFGPHKDDIEFFLDDLNLKYYGSQGQQRIAVLTFKLSEIEIFKKYKNSTPILLLDDIFSEIDQVKKRNLLKYVSKDIQTIITTTDLSDFNEKMLKSAKIFNITNGKITREVIK